MLSVRRVRQAWGEAVRVEGGLNEHGAHTPLVTAGPLWGGLSVLPHTGTV